MNKLAGVVAAMVVVAVVGFSSFSSANVKLDVSKIDTYLIESIRDNDPFVLYQVAYLKREIKDVLAEINEAILQNPEGEDADFLKEAKRVMQDDLYFLEQILIFVEEDVDVVGVHVGVTKIFLEKIKQ